MQASEIAQVAWVGDEYVAKPVRGIVLAFHGLGGGMKSEPSTEELEWGRAGGLVVYPYCGPWSWMNRITRTFVDELIDAVYSSRGLSRKLPLISTGGSMGGQCTLLHTRYTKHKVCACLASFPVCDVSYHFSERPDLPSTFRFAYRGYAESWESVIAEHSPLAQVAHMPEIPYLFIHGDADKAVNKTAHSDRMVAAMRARGLRVEYMEVPGMTHGGIVPLSVVQRRVDFVRSFLE